MRSSFGCLCLQVLNLVSSLELGGDCGSRGLLPWVFWGSAHGNLQYHSETLSVGSWGVILNNSSGNKQWDLACCTWKQKKKKEGKGKEKQGEKMRDRC